jgi:hypothetical protein
MDSCTGTAFSDATFQNVASGYYLAKSTSDDSLVLYTGTGQRLDGYYDTHHHLIIYICGTNYVYTVGASCSSTSKLCGYVENYTDSPDQWWNRVYAGNDEEDLQSAAHKNGWALTDPHGAKTEGEHVTLSGMSSHDKNQLFVFRD